MFLDPLLSSQWGFMRTVLIGTRNPNKVREIATVLGPCGVRLLSLSEWNAPLPEVVEDGQTFRDNAVKKAMVLAEASGHWVLADDSGIEVDALGGRPGVFSARYAGPNATDEQNNAKLLMELSGVSSERRAARYVCVIALARPGRLLGVVEGTCEGVVASEPRGTGGFGYDPVFYVPELGKTFAEVAPEVKNRLSHRGKALEALRALFERLLREQRRSEDMH